ncbi:hypothetical protein FQZ97_1240520 [compost metagenome]
MAITMNSGTTPSCVGTAMVAITKTSSPLLPRKRSLANANPARVEKITTEADVTVETRMLLPMAFQKGMLSKTFAALARKFPPGRSGMPRLSAVLSWLPTRKDQYSGNREASRTAPRAP